MGFVAFAVDSRRVARTLTGQRVQLPRLPRARAISGDFWRAVGVVLGLLEIEEFSIAELSQHVHHRFVITRTGFREHNGMNFQVEKGEVIRRMFESRVSDEATLVAHISRLIMERLELQRKLLRGEQAEIELEIYRARTKAARDRAIAQQYGTDGRSIGSRIGDLERCTSWFRRLV